jgi:hypothetical protein
MNRENVIKEFEKRSLSAQVLKFFPAEVSGMRLEKDSNAIACSYAEDHTLIKSSKESNIIVFDEFELIGTGKTEEIALDNVIRKDNIFMYNLLLNACNSPTPLENEIVNYISDQKDGVDFKGVLERLQFQVEKNRLLVDKFIMSNRIFMNMENLLDRESEQYEKALTPVGIVGSMWGVNLLRMDFITCPSAIAFAVTEGQYLGIRTITRITTTAKLVAGVTELFVKGQMGIVNPRAVSCMVDNQYVRKCIDFEKIQKQWEDVCKADVIENAEEKFKLIVAK